MPRAAQARGLHFDVFAAAVIFVFQTIAKRPFELSPTVRPLALAEHTY